MVQVSSASSSSGVDLLVPSTELVQPAKVEAKHEATPSFLAFIQGFRGIAILFIVAIHCIPFLDIPGRQSALAKVLMPIIDRGTLLFIFIGGYLFQHLSHRFNIKKYYSNKIQNVIIPYLIVSLPIIVVRIATDIPADAAVERFPNFSESSAVFQIIYYYATGLHLAPFWFVPMISFYYLIAPILVRLDNDKRIYYFLPVLLGISLVITRSGSSELVYLSVIHFFSIYLLGMFFSRHKELIIRFTDRYIKILLTITLFAVVASMLAYNTAFREQTLFIQKTLISWCFLYSLHRFENRIPKAIGLLAKMSFGIYFLHYYILYVIQKVNENLFGDKYFAFTASNFFILLTLSIGISMAILHLGKKILGSRSRMFVGY